MSTKIRSWNVRRVENRVVELCADPRVIEPQKIYHLLETIEAVTREEATALAQARHPGVEINISRVQ